MSHHTDNEDFDQTASMFRLILIFVGHTCRNRFPHIAAQIFIIAICSRSDSFAHRRSSLGSRTYSTSTPG